MTTGSPTSNLDDRLRQLIAQQKVCIAAALGPDGDIDGNLIFGRPAVQVTADGLLQFPLEAIEEGSRLRAWLRISRHTGKDVPWSLLFVDRENRARVLVTGAAKLFAGSPGPDMQRTTSLMVEMAPSQPIEEGTRSSGVEVAQPVLAGPDGTKDSALRTMTQRPAKEVTEPVRSFLARGTEAFLCSITGDQRPRIELFAAASGRAVLQGPDIALEEQTFYLRRVAGDVQAEDAGRVLLIVPSYGSQLAVRAAGVTHTMSFADAPPSIQNALAGASRILSVAVSRLEVQAGDWSALKEPAAQNGNIRVAKSVLRVHGSRSIGRAEVAFVGGPTVLTRGGESLLELAEANGVPMESGCRMGICGADPVRIDAGGENLSRIRHSEQSTLDRMGLPPGCRMACSARVRGSVTVAPVDDVSEVEFTEVEQPRPAVGFPIDPEVRRVVVIGTGIAGITSVEEVRKLHPTVEITLVGAEHHDFYNRMAISRLVDEDTTPDKLSLMSSDWARRRRVLYLPGVSIAAIDRERREVVPVEGVRMPYDRLVLAMGARSRVPTIEGIELAGTFVMRTIDDALDIRRHTHLPDLRRAVVIGGGLLGLEAAYHLTQTGLRVWIVGRAEWPANRQLDEHAGGLLSEMLQDLGIQYIPNSEPRRLVGDERIEGMELMDGRVLPADLCLVAAGIVPEVDLAREAGLEVVQGVVVDDHMKTSDPAIYAAGDLIEYRGRSFGLWPASVDQALVAATNLLGGDLAYNATMAPAQLKVPGIDLLSVGEIAPRSPEEQTIRTVDRHARRYRKLVLREGRALGAIVIGSPGLFDGITEAVQTGRDMSAQLGAIERGDWSALTGDEGGVEDASLTASGVK